MSFHFIGRPKTSPTLLLKLFMKHYTHPSLNPTNKIPSRSGKHLTLVGVYQRPFCLHGASHLVHHLWCITSGASKLLPLNPLLHQEMPVQPWKPHFPLPSLPFRASPSLRLPMSSLTFGSLNLENHLPLRHLSHHHLIQGLWHTSYLSRADGPGPWRKNLSCGEISNFCT